MTRVLQLIFLVSLSISCQDNHELKFAGIEILSDQERLDQLAKIENPTKQQSMELADLYLKGGSLSASESKYEELVARYPKDAELAYLLGSVLFELRDYKPAVEHLEYSVRSGVVRWNTYYQLAVAQTKLTNLDKANQYLELLSSMPAGDKMAMTLKGDIAWQLSDTIKAISSWEAANDFESHYKTYKVFSSIDSSSRAIVHALKMVELNAKSDSAFNFVGLSLLGIDLPDSAMIYFQRAFQINDHNIVAINQLAALHYSNRVYDSTNYFARILINSDSKDRGLLWQARVFDRRREFANSRTKYLELLDLNPGHEIGQSELANLDRKIRYLRTIRQEESPVETNN